VCRQLAVLGKLSSKACWLEGHLSVTSYSPPAPKNRSPGCASPSSRQAQPGVLDALGYVFGTQVA
uniref:Uncharacterized protein n=1 Tax=Pan troglodytes TaxID=9598 RepID=A0A2I3SDI0_PANTR